MFGIIENIFGAGNLMIGMAAIGLVVQWTIAIFVVRSGIKYLSKPDA